MSTWSCQIEGKCIVMVEKAFFTIECDFIYTYTYVCMLLHVCIYLCLVSIKDTYYIRSTGVEVR